jgi:ATPase family protein associated with various cellular activities (AAA)/peptidase M41-like protein
MAPPEKGFEPWASWEACSDPQGQAALDRLAADLPIYFAESTLLSCRWTKLSFYEGHRLMELTFVREHGIERAFALDGPDRTVWLDGNSAAIHSTNDAESLALVDSVVADYIHFFFYFLRGDDGAFVLIESADEVQLGTPTDADADAADGDDDDDDDAITLTLEAARAKAKPVKVNGVDSEGRWVADVTVAYADGMFEAQVAVPSDGVVEMVDDKPVGLLNGLIVPLAPSLDLDIQPVETPTAPVAEAAAKRPGDREVTEAVVTVLLEDAMRVRNADTGVGGQLLRHFNTQTNADKPIEQLARLLAESKAMVVIESDIPFVEDVVARLVAPEHAEGGSVRARPMAGEDLRCEISMYSSCQLYLLSFHTYRDLFDAERTAHDLALSEAPVLIGCNRVKDVPEPLRRVTDLVLTFARIDRRSFVRIFESVFGAKPTAGWDSGGADWTRYLVPGDFHVPRRLGLGPDESLALLRDRVDSRLSLVTPDTEDRLSGLHGLGEARQIAEDLIADIQAAQAGRIPWSAVDRGLLLVGAPGTGKTTLGRAVANECGVKFVVASAAAWQSAGHLDAHLRAMRADFVEARRFAPAILFIDEIDAVGSRENMSGDNAQYHTQVVDSLLELIQGIDSTDPVIVIGATNYVDNVDPALRRAGRLDQVVEIPLPNIDSLEKIFGFHLARFEGAGGQLGPDVHARALAELALGLTAADVEFFVRGAARRARRESRPVGQQDLLAEVTRRPRHPDSAPRLTPAEMRRVAVHEAGHTVARLTSSTRGEDLTFVSIIPRLDGSLGFTASVPDSTRVLTRRTLIEQLETMLAGRAAEEVVFGADDIGAGAGGESTSSDLAVATQLATLLVCRSGLGDEGLLRWTTEPTAVQEAKIDELLRDTYANIRTRLQESHALLDRVVDALELKQELSGNELRRLIGSADQKPASTF